MNPTQSKYHLNATPLLLTLVASILLNGCSAKVIDKDKSSQDKAEVIELKHVIQRTIRYSCQNQIVSDQMETIEAPSKLIQINPTLFADLSRTVYTNLNNGSVPNCIFENTKFYVDMAHTLCNMQVTEGLNQIEYKFYYCSSKEEGACQKPELKEQGTVYIHVNYTEEINPETAEVHPSMEECKKSGTK